MRSWGCFILTFYPREHPTLQWIPVRKQFSVESTELQTIGNNSGKILWKPIQNIKNDGPFTFKAQHLLFKIWHCDQLTTSYQPNSSTGTKLFTFLVDHHFFKFPNKAVKLEHDISIVYSWDGIWVGDCEKEEKKRLQQQQSSPSADNGGSSRFGHWRSSCFCKPPSCCQPVLFWGCLLLRLYQGITEYGWLGTPLDLRT